MGYDCTSYDRQIENFKAQNKKDDIESYASGLLPEQKLGPVITLILYYGDDDLPDNICAMLNMLKESSQTLLHTRDTLFTLAAITKDQRY